MTESVPCCTSAVYDSEAGWWCPHHGDRMEARAQREAGIDPGDPSTWPFGEEDSR